MAQYRFHAAIVCRSGGQSVVAAAAYRAGETLHDERTGEIKDYSRRAWSVLYTRILTPENAPAWMRDRQRLWNGVEQREDFSTKRSTAQLARSLELSLPHELTHEQHVQLVCDFVKAEFVDRGMIADIAIHAPPYRGDGTNHHAHILLTMRAIDDEGVFGNKNRAWNKDELLEEWRERWADYQNRALEKYGFDACVDHRTLEDQGIDREPTIHLGPSTQALEDQGIPTDRGDQNRRIKSNNDNLALAKQDLADSEKRLAALRRLYAAEQMEQIRKTVSVADAVWNKEPDQPGTPGPPDRPLKPSPPEPEPRVQTQPRRPTAAERIEQIQKTLHAADTAWKKHEQPQPRTPEPEPPPPDHPPEPKPPEPEPPAPIPPPVPSGPAPRGNPPAKYADLDQQTSAERTKEEAERQRKEQEEKGREHKRKRRRGR
jgi:hypothetical protein